MAVCVGQTVALWEINDSRFRDSAIQMDGQAFHTAIVKTRDTLLTSTLAKDGTYSELDARSLSRPDREFYKARIPFPVGMMQLSPDERWLHIVGDNGRRLIGWDVNAGTQHASLIFPQRSAEITLGPSTASILSTHIDGVVRQWTLSTTKEWTATERNQPTVHNEFDVIFCNDGGYLVRAGTDSLRRFDRDGVDSGRELLTAKSIQSFTSSSDGRRVGTMDRDGQIYIWNVEKELVEDIPLSKGGSYPFALSPDGRWLVYGDGAMGITRLRNCDERRDTETWAGCHYLNTAFSADSKWITTWSPPGVFIVRSCALRETRFALPVAGDAIAAAINNDGRTVLILHPNTLEMRQVETGKLLGDFHALPDFSVFLSFARDGEVALGACENGTAVIWQLNGTNVSSKELSHNGKVTCAAFFPNDGVVATGTYAGDSILWDTSTGYPIGPPRRDFGSPVALLADADNRVLVIRTATVLARRPLPDPITGTAQEVLRAVEKNVGANELTDKSRSR